MSSREPSLAEKYFLRGDDLRLQGKFEAALDAYAKGLEISSDNEKAWNNCGVVLAGLGRYEDALEAYDKAIEINPAYAKAWNNKGAALDSSVRFQEALKAYGRAIELSPNDQKAWVNMAMVFIKMYKSR